MCSNKLKPGMDRVAIRMEKFESQNAGMQNKSSKVNLGSITRSSNNSHQSPVLALA